MVQYSSAIYKAKISLQSFLWRTIVAALPALAIESIRQHEAAQHGALQRVEAQLKQQKELLALVHKTTQDGIWDYNIASGQMWLSPRWKAMFGYFDHELENSMTTVRALMLDEDYAHSCKLADNHIRHNIPFHGVFRFRHKDGSLRHILSHAYIVKDTSGTPVRMVGANTDLTEQLALQQNLSMHKAELSLLQHCLPNMIYQFISTPMSPFILTSLHGQMVELCGFNQDEMTRNSKLLWGIIHPGDRRRIFNSAQQAIYTWTPWNSQHRIIYQGNERWVHTEFMPLSRANTHITWKGVMIDITRFRSGSA